MTITNTDRSATSTGNGLTTVWSYGFLIPDAASANVKLIEIATGIETVISSGDYTITGLGNAAGGTITYPKTGSPLTSTHKIVRFRSVAATQTTNVTNQTKYNASVVMAVWDRIVMMIQELTDDLSRSLRSAVGDAKIEALPNATTRASKFLAFDSSGDPIAASVVDSVPVSTFMETLLDDTTAAAGRTTLDAASGAQGTLADNALPLAGGVMTGGITMGGNLLTNGRVVARSLGTTQASATTVTPPLNGNTFQISGTTTITGFANLQIGLEYDVIATGAFAVTDSATLIVEGGSQTFAVGDRFRIFQLTSTIWHLYGISPIAGSGANRSYTRSTTEFDITTGIPDDNTIPQKTEGDQILSTTITPTSTTAKLRITVEVALGSGNIFAGVALFQNTDADAIASDYVYTATGKDSISFSYEFVPASTSLQTFTVRAGPVPSGTIYINQNHAGVSKFGGTIGSSITVEEV